MCHMKSVLYTCWDAEICDSIIGNECDGMQISEYISSLIDCRNMREETLFLTYSALANFEVHT